MSTRLRRTRTATGNPSRRARRIIMGFRDYRCRLAVTTSPLALVRGRAILKSPSPKERRTKFSCDLDDPNLTGPNLVQLAPTLYARGGPKMEGNDRSPSGEESPGRGLIATPALIWRTYLLTLSFASWNPIDEWLRRLNALRHVG